MNETELNRFVVFLHMKSTGYVSGQKHLISWWIRKHSLMCMWSKVFKTIFTIYKLYSYSVIYIERKDIYTNNWITRFTVIGTCNTSYNVFTQTLHVTSLFKHAVLIILTARLHSFQCLQRNKTSNNTAG